MIPQQRARNSAPTSQFPAHQLRFSPVCRRQAWRLRGWPLLLSLLLLGGCIASQIGGPTAPRNDASAGTLTLPTGRSVAVYPDELAYTGKARFRWPDGREYDGDWVLGVAEGFGTETSPQDEVYRGTWRRGRRDGRGELTTPNGDRYVGDFVNNVRRGQGTRQSSDGLYQGSWANDLPEGQGDYFGNDGSHYRGQWQRGVRHGQGVYVARNGSRYEGDWAQDVPHGFGTITNPDGSVYFGEWRNNQRSGYGRLRTLAEVTYEGTWQAGKRHGYGTSHSPDGSRYAGEWHNGQRDGHGRADYADGRFHDGSWENSQVLGPGTRRQASGMEITGMWNGDFVTTGLLRLPDGAEYAGNLFRKRNTEVAAGLLQWLESQASSGNAFASYLLGTAYSDYRQPPPDGVRARRHFAEAAAAGLPDAQYRLALLSIAAQADEAIGLLSAAAATGHTNASALLGRYYATGTYVMRDTSVAITYLAQASDRGDLAARNSLAWILATYPQSMLRDGQQALVLARPLAALYEHWQQLDTLAAAYAETGSFEDAVRAQRQAIALAEADANLSSDPTLMADLQARLTLYENNQPFREGDDMRPSDE